jgi:uncharacterized protein (TIGR01777 family)
MTDEISQTHSSVPLRTVAVTGGTGYVGSALVDRLVEEHYQVTCLTRDTQRAGQGLPPGVVAKKWLGSDAPSKSLLKGMDAVVHLAGAPAVGTRLTDAKKDLIMRSRVDTAEQLVQTMRNMASPPKVFVCASAVGYYGAANSDVTFTEADPPGDDFLAEVCIRWEAAATKAEELGVRVVRTRIGIVFGRDGGPLQVMARPFRLFAGGPIAGGRQVVSWIDRRDVVSALTFCLERDDVHGAVNLCSPNAATNGEISAAIASALGRPNYLPVPKVGLRMLFGEGADVIASGQRVTPAALLEYGFSFEHADLDACLRDHLGS